jgi:hypothetical protein
VPRTVRSTAGSFGPFQLGYLSLKHHSERKKVIPGGLDRGVFRGTGRNNVMLVREESSSGTGTVDEWRATSASLTQLQ